MSDLFNPRFDSTTLTEAIAIASGKIDESHDKTPATWELLKLGVENYLRECLGDTRLRRFRESSDFLPLTLLKSDKGIQYQMFVGAKPFLMSLDGSQGNYQQAVEPAGAAKEYADSRSELLPLRQEAHRIHLALQAELSRKCDYIIRNPFIFKVAKS